MGDLGSPGWFVPFPLAIMCLGPKCHSSSNGISDTLLFVPPPILVRETISFFMSTISLLLALLPSFACLMQNRCVSGSSNSLSHAFLASLLEHSWIFCSVHCCINSWVYASLASLFSTITFWKDVGACMEFLDWKSIWKLIAMAIPKWSNFAAWFMYRQSTYTLRRGTPEIATLSMKWLAEVVKDDGLSQWWNWNTSLRPVQSSNLLLCCIHSSLSFFFPSSRVSFALIVRIIACWFFCFNSWMKTSRSLRHSVLHWFLLWIPFCSLLLLWCIYFCAAVIVPFVVCCLFTCSICCDDSQTCPAFFHTRAWRINVLNVMGLPLLLLSLPPSGPLPLVVFLLGGILSLYSLGTLHTCWLKLLFWFASRGHSKVVGSPLVPSLSPVNIGFSGT